MNSIITRRLKMLKKHPYIITGILAIILSTTIWLCMPKMYAAQVKISDEYKETDLSVGLDKFGVTIRDLLGNKNSGINNIETYCRILKSPDLAKKIAHIKVGLNLQEYASYISKKDTIQYIIDKIDYNLNTKQQTLVIQFEDQDPLIAAQILDSITYFLQKKITEERHTTTRKIYKNAIKKKHDAFLAYKKALNNFTKYADSFPEDKNLPSIELNKKALQQEIDDKYKLYAKTVETCKRYEMLQKREYSSFAIVKGNIVPIHTKSFLIGYILLGLSISVCIVKTTRLLSNWKKRKKIIDFGNITSPWNITICIWGAIIISLCFRDSKLLYAPNEQFYTSLAIWLILFNITSYITYQITPYKGHCLADFRKQAASPIRMNKINNYIFHILFFTSIIITPLYVKKIMDIALMFGTKDLLLNLRNLAVFGYEKSFLNYSFVINEVLMIVALWAYPSIKLWKVIVACLANLLNALAIMEKGGILLIIFCIIFILYQRDKIKLKFIVLIAICVIFFSYGFTLLRAGEDSSNSSDEFSIFNFIAMYIMSPPVEYCTLHRELVPQFGAHTFPLIYLFLNKEGFGNYVFFDRLQDFVFVPVSTNVYTIFQPFFMDFGQLGIAIFAVIYGIIMGTTYRQMRNGNCFAKCLYMYFGYVLTLQFFQEYLFTGNMHIIQLIVFLYFCTQQTFNLTIAKK